MPTKVPIDSQVRQQFLDQLLALWPAFNGCLSQVRKPCIRPNCPACARGDKHPAFIFSFVQKGRRRCMYVPAELAPLFREGLDNGRKLQALLSEIGPALLRLHRQERARKPKP
jgi:hypothetical protein